MLNAPTLRSELDYIWRTFVEIKNAADGSISYQELLAYMSINGRLSNFEIDAIIALDLAHKRESIHG